MFLVRLNDFHVAQIPDCENYRYNLPDDGCDSRAHHAPAKYENKYGVQNDVDSRTGKGGSHGKFRISVCPDNRIHCLTEHIEGDSQRNIEEVFLGVVEGFRVYCTAKHSDDLIGENQIDRRKHKTAEYSHNHGAAYAVLRGSHILFSQTDAYESAAAVADHHGYGKRHHRQGKYYGIGSIAVRAKIAGIGNKNLVYDVIKRAYQKGDNAGQGISLHQLSDALCP